MVQVLAACARDPDLVLAGAEAVAALGRRRDVCGHERDQVFSRLEGAGWGHGACGAVTLKKQRNTERNRPNSS